MDWNAIKSIQEFDLLMATIVKDKHVDVVHANDWMTVPAGILLQQQG